MEVFSIQPVLVDGECMRGPVYGPWHSGDLTQRVAWVPYDIVMDDAGFHASFAGCNNEAQGGRL